MTPILILHGWGSCAKNWGRVKELLEREGLKVFVPDLPGFGESSPPAQPWSVDNYVEWVKDFSGKNNLDQFFLLGHSFGGRLAIKFAVKYPEKLKGLILAASAGVSKRKSLKSLLFFAIAKLGGVFFALPIVGLLKPGAQRIIYKLAGVNDYFLAKGVMKETMKRVIVEDLKPYLSKITTKTLIVWGEKDNTTPLSDAYLMKKEIPNSKLEILVGAGHRLRIDAPEKLSEIIMRFLRL